MSVTRPKVIAAVVLVITFAAGVIAGGIGVRVWMFRHQNGTQLRQEIALRLVHRLDNDLQLTPQQHTEVQRIIDTHRARIDAIMDGVHPQVRREIDQTNDEIARILTPEQRTKFESLKMRFLIRRGGPHHR